MAEWYLGSTKYTAVAQWAANTAYVVGNIVRQLAAPAVNAERCFRCTTAGTSHATTEPTWVLTKAATTNDNDVVWTEVTGDSAYGWDAPHAKMTTAASWMAAGDTLWVSNNHDESTDAAYGVTFPGLLANPNTVICVSDADAVPTTRATGAQVKTGNGIYGLSIAGAFYCYGVDFKSGVGGNPNAPIALAQHNGSNVYKMVYESCNFVLPSNASATFKIGGAISFARNMRVTFINTNVTFANIAQTISLYQVQFEWLSGTAICTAIPTQLLTPVSDYNAKALVSGVDLSQMTGNYLVNNTSAHSGGSIIFCGCKMHATPPTSIKATVLVEAWEAIVDCCDSGTGTTKSEFYAYGGSTIVDTGIYRSGGASDGTTPHSMKITTLADQKFRTPFYARPLIVWNDATGSSKTVTIEIVHDSATNLKDDEVWLEVVYLGDASYTLTAIANDMKASELATAADQATSSVTWEGTGGMANPNKQKLVVTLTPQLKGLFEVRVAVAKASKTLYYCPKAEVA